MTQRADGPGDVRLTQAEQRLAAVYLQVVEFVAARAARGDRAARGHLAGFTRAGNPYPPRAMIRSWLADCAAELRLFRPAGDPYGATQLLAAMNAAEAHAAGAADRAWASVVEGLRAGRLRVPGAR